MSIRIDHVDEAERFLDFAKSTTVDAASEALAQIGAAHAALALVEQQRIANRLKVAELDLLEEIGYKRLGGHALDFRIRQYLTADDWTVIEVPEDDGVWAHADHA